MKFVKYVAQRLSFVKKELEFRLNNSAFISHLLYDQFEMKELSNFAIVTVLSPVISDTLSYIIKFTVYPCTEFLSGMCDD